ncbi:unnamed protein product [Adineta ricciae]|uniref:Uncharacterized protein n=1 Tax=Adineta ricciae TaxID=249248 RepID=A0A814C5A1_ADIRI|nr:unnamed protein product [Adineta ricciae]CAF1111710.1 unnamed protein product [Adineta ricciae]
MSLAFERLPDEIIMSVMEFSGDVFDILRIYLGLNERFNHILLDQRQDDNSRAWMGGCSIVVDYFLFLTIYQLQCIHYLTCNVSTDINCYRAVIGLALFIFQCQNQVVTEILSLFVHSN